MANMTDLGFDSQTVEPTSFEALPAGDYLVVATDSDRKPTKNGNGERLNVTFEVLEPVKLKGRKLFAGFNIKNQNPEAVRIALGELSALCRAAGVGKLQDSAQLHSVPVVVNLACKKREDGTVENAIKSYKPRAAMTQTTSPTGVAGAASPGGAPWAK